MIGFKGKAISSNISMFYVYIKKDDNGDLFGSVFNDTYGFATEFNGIGQMIGTLDDLFSYVNFPMATHEERNFQKKKEKKQDLPEELYSATAEDFKEEVPLFHLHVQFRQNSTWQGTLEWIPMKKTKRFRSELELVRLMMKALGC